MIPLLTTASLADLDRVYCLDVRQFGMTGDGLTDETDAFHEAIAAAAPRSTTLAFPPGTYRFARRPDPIPVGLRLAGAGSCGSTPGMGTYLVADYDETDREAGFLTWDGSHPSGFRGTGGGIIDVVLYKAGDRSGGAALKFTGADDTHRAGYSFLSNLLVTGKGTWDSGLLVDGSHLTTPGGLGVRTIHVQNLNVARTTRPGASVLLRGATHFYWFGGQIMPVGVANRTGLLVTGSPNCESSNLHIMGVNVLEDLTFDHANTFLFFGRVGRDLTITKYCNAGMVKGVLLGKVRNEGTAVTTEDHFGRITGRLGSVV